MATLEHTTIWRKGASQAARKFKRLLNPVELGTRYSDSPERRLRLSFTVSASGVGYSNYRLLVDPEDYAAILKAMCDVDEQAAMAAMAAELAKRLSERAG